ncbi:hypothetical protein K474DRAFT_1643428 [Panus rudis PR-1116 ss-1]|nr:hypothetical protein K474DRAFT_1643428 [Panus rudis PR-1116 ss-1]
MSVFKFNREGYAVKVDNIAPSVGFQEVVELFRNLIGDVSKWNATQGEGNRRSLELVFSTFDASKKALCMSGYTVAGVPLYVHDIFTCSEASCMRAPCYLLRSVTAVPQAGTDRPTKQNKLPDSRRNLYVLGLPFDLTRAEYVEAFSKFGTVSHAVILATVDNASRRRGFVVMGSHDEARAAMEGLSRKEIKGHTIDVSWAVVQRSQGFLDGGDRTVVLSSSSSPVSPVTPAFDSDPPTSAASSCVSSPVVATPLINQPMPLALPDHLSATSSILVTNLPASLFSTELDLYPLLCPFGEVKSLKILGSGAAASSQGTTSVLVEYKSYDGAREARDTLQGQTYGNQPVRVDFLASNSGMSPSADGGYMPYSAEAKARLNPCAPVFSIPCGYGNNAPTQACSPYLRQKNMNVHDDVYLRPQGYIGNPFQPAPLNPMNPSYNNYLLPPPVSARPNSAPSRYVGPMMTCPKNESLDSIWTEDTRALSRVAPWACASPNLPNLSTPSLQSHFLA